MKKWLKAQKKNFVVICSFIIPALIMVLISITEDYAPFGKFSILMGDMRCQFVDYIAYMKTVFFGNNDLLYTFSKTFGGDMTGFFAYYLSNPFYLILMFCPNEFLPSGIVIMIIIIVGFCGMNFNLLLKEVFGQRVSTLIFSTAYAFMGFIVTYMNCMMYLFPVLMLPLIILGLFRTVKNKRMSLLYVVTLTSAIISCYYISYMIVLFSAMFFLYLIFSDFSKDYNKKEKLHIIWTAIYSTIFSVGISAFCLLSVVLSLKGQKSSGLSTSFSRNFRMTDFFSGLYSNAFHGNISDGLPIVYSGVVTIVFLFFYFCNKQSSIKDRILAGAMFLIMMVSFWIDALNVMWHGFAHTIGFPYRNSFLFSFLAIFFGYWGFCGIKDSFKKIFVVIFGVMYAEYSLYLYFTQNEYVGLRQILITFLIILLTFVCIQLMCTNWKYVVPAIVGLFFLQFMDLYNNGYMSLDAYYTDKDTLLESYSEKEYTDYVTELTAIVDKINSEDDGLFRIDKLFRRSLNDAMMAGYNGLSHFSSCENIEVKDFMGKIGLVHNDLWAYYGSGSTSFIDCFMGLKYLLSQYDETCKPFKSDFSYNDKYVYENPYALQFGFVTTDEVKRINMEEKDPFKLQNSMAKSFTGTQYEIYKPVEVKDIVLQNVQKDGNRYIKINPSEEAYIEYELNVISDNFIYMYFSAPGNQKTDLTVNGLSKQPYFTTYDWCIRECGYFDPGTTASVRFALLQDEIEIDDYYFYYENANVLRRWYEDVTINDCSVEKVTSSHLIANVKATNKENQLVFSIPYDDNWEVMVDGKEVKTEKVMDALMSVKLSEGTHVVELRYVPFGLKVGIPISIGFLLITVFVYIRSRKKVK